MNQQDDKAQKSSDVEEPKSLAKLLLGAAVVAVLWFTVFSDDSDED